MCQVELGWWRWVVGAGLGGWRRDSGGPHEEVGWYGTGSFSETKTAGMWGAWAVPMTVIRQRCRARARRSLYISFTFIVSWEGGFETWASHYNCCQHWQQQYSAQRLPFQHRLRTGQHAADAFQYELILSSGDPGEVATMSSSFSQWRKLRAQTGA